MVQSENRKKVLLQSIFHKNSVFKNIFIIINHLFQMRLKLTVVF